MYKSLMTYGTQERLKDTGEQEQKIVDLIPDPDKMEKLNSS